MPQLMPIFWIGSVFTVLLLFVVMMLMYYYNKEMLCVVCDEYKVCEVYIMKW